MSKYVNAIWLTFRAVAIALSLLLGVALWFAPHMSIADLWLAPGDDTSEQLVAIRSEGRGIFPYYGRAVNVYRTGEQYRDIEVFRGILLDGLAKTIVSCLVLVCIVVTAVKPSIAKNAIHRLTMRWSGS